jgi:hypothetical protein
MNHGGVTGGVLNSPFHSGNWWEPHHTFVYGDGGLGFRGSECGDRSAAESREQERHGSVGGGTTAKYQIYQK